MDFANDNAGLGLTEDQINKIAQFQELTGIEDISICREVLQRHQWNVEVAIQEQLNIREGRPSVYASEARPPAVISDHIRHVFYSPPSDGSASGLRGFIKSILNFFWTMCYNTIITFLQIGRRIIRPEERELTRDPIQEIQDFIVTYNEKYSDVHPVFYQGTYAQVLNDAKRELKFLLIYLHNDDAVDTNKFCRSTLANQQVIRYINNNFLFWACSIKSNEGYKVCQIFHPKYYPFLSIVVLKDNKMMIVGRMEGFCEAEVLLERLSVVVDDNEINLIRARNERMEASLNRSLRQHQDEAFQESLRADQEKEKRRQEEREAVEAERRRIQEELMEEERRREEIARLKIDSVVKVPSEPDISHPDAIHIVIKLPCGTRLDRRFLKSHSLEAVYYFVFCHPKSPDSFEITTNFPKRVLNCRANPGDRIQTLEEAGLKNREVLFINDLDA